MAKEAKKATKQNYSPLDLDTLRTRIKSSPGARRALASIVRDGCKETSLLNSLLPYFQHDAKRLEQKKRSNENFTNRLGTMARRLTEDATELTRLFGELRSEKEMKTGTDIKVRVHGPVRKLPQKMTSLADFLLGLSRGLRKIEDPEDKMNSVIYVCCLVKAATGKTHFTDIARVISAGTGDQSEVVPKLADNIRNQINRDRKCKVTSKNKSKRKSILERACRYQLMHDLAAEEVSQWR